MNNPLVLLAGTATVVGTVLFGYLAIFSSHANTTLAWAPPTLVNPTTVTLTSTSKKALLDTTKDYIVKLSGKITGTGAINIVGGHNVVVIGGEINHTETGGPAGDPGKDQRGLYLQNWTGTLHIEGVYISGTTLGEGIDIDTAAPGAVLQLENIRIDTVHGTYATNHADIIQNWGGPVTYRIDHLTGSTLYQGFFIQSSKYGPMTQSLDFRNVNLTGADGLGHYLYYNATGLTTSNVSLSNVWSNPQYPGSVACGCYPESDPIWVTINHGTPPGGDFVTAADVGTGYISPGYGGATPTQTPTPTPTPSPTQLIGDINGDGKVNAVDLSTLLSKWGTNDAAADINHDGAVNAVDLSIVLSRWTG